MKIHKILNKDSKVLLYSASDDAKIKPEGIRWFCRFPKHVLTDYNRAGTDSQTICFIPTEDVDIYGFGHYRHHELSVSYMEVRMKIRITNEKDEDPPLVEKEFETIEITYADM